LLIKEDIIIPGEICWKSKGLLRMAYPWLAYACNLMRLTNPHNKVSGQEGG
jgi:hypothetical protein